MALSFFHRTIAPLFGHRGLPAAADLSFLQDVVHPEVTDALLGFVYDPADPALDDLLNLPPPPVVDDAVLVPAHAQLHDARYGLLGADAGHHRLALLPPQQLRGGGGADNAKQSTCQSAAARQRRKRISEKTGELSRLIPGGHRMNTAEMLEEAARHVKLLQAQVGVLALMRSNEEYVAQEEEQMHALLVRGRVQERLAAAGRCLAPTKLVDAVAKDRAVTSNAVVNRDLGRFVASLGQ